MGGGRGSTVGSWLITIVRIVRTGRMGKEDGKGTGGNSLWHKCFVLRVSWWFGLVFQKWCRVFYFCAEHISVEVL